MIKIAKYGLVCNPRNLYIYTMKAFLWIPFVILLATSQTPIDQNTYRIAQSFESSGEYERAAALYESLYKKDSLNYVYFDALRRVYIQLKEIDKAIDLSYRRLRRAPFDFALQTSIGGLYSTAGDTVKADSVWNFVLSSAKKNSMIYRTVANEQANNRLFTKAIATYLKGRRDLGDPNAFANDLAYLYTFMMDYKNATREYIRLLEQNDQQFDFIKSRIISFAEQDQGLASALEVITDALNDKETIPLLRLKMWLLMEDNRYADAFTVAEKIERTINSGGREIFQFANQAFGEREYGIAAKAYTFAVQSGLSMQFIPQAKMGYARCIEELSGLTDTAVAHLKGNALSLLDIHPSFSAAIALFDSIAAQYPYTSVRADAMYRVGLIQYTRLFDLDAAMQTFNALLSIAPAGPMVPTVLSSVGNIFIDQGKLDKAGTTFIKMKESRFASQDQKTTAEFMLAKIQFYEGNFDSALVLLKPLTENLKADESNDALLLQYFITENSVLFREALKQYAHAQLLAQQRKASEAVQMFSTIVSTYPSAPLADDALMKKAEYSIQLHLYDTALVAYQQVLNQYTHSIDKDKTQFKIGELYQFFIGDKQQAIKAYEAILEKYPYSLYADESRKRIRMLRGDAL